MLGAGRHTRGMHVTEREAWISPLCNKCPDSDRICCAWPSGHFKTARHKAHYWGFARQTPGLRWLMHHRHLVVDSWSLTPPTFQPQSSPPTTRMPGAARRRSKNISSGRQDTTRSCASQSPESRSCERGPPCQDPSKRTPRRNQGWDVRRQQRISPPQSLWNRSSWTRSAVRIP